jgi:hypothetical protein
MRLSFLSPLNRCADCGSTNIIREEDKMKSDRALEVLRLKHKRKKITPEIIQRAFRERAKKVHPDCTKLSNEQMIWLLEARREALLYMGRQRKRMHRNAERPVDVVVYFRDGFMCGLGFRRDDEDNICFPVNSGSLSGTGDN